MPTAEVLRDQETDTQDQGQPTLPRQGTGLSDLAGMAMGERQRVSQGTQDILRQREATAAPLREDVRTAGHRMEQIAGQVPEAPTLPPMPDTKRRPFLEGPGKQSDIIREFVNAISLLAAPVGGLVAKNGQAAATAMNGAMQGWMQGDDARVDREMAAWDLHTRQMLSQWRLQKEHYDDILKSSKISHDLKRETLELVLNQHESPLASQAEQEKSLDAFVKWIGQQQVHADTLSMKHEEMLTRMKIAELIHSAKDEKTRTVEQLTAASLKGDKDAKRILDDMEERQKRISVAGAHARAEGFGDIRIAPYIDTQSGTITGLNSNDYNTSSKKEPGRYVPYAPAMATGQAPGEMLGKKADLAALGASLRDAEKRVTLTNIYMNTIEENVPTVRAAMKRYGKNQFGRLLNQAQNNLKQGIEGSGELSAFQLALNSLSQEVGKLESGSLGVAEVSVSQSALMRKMHDWDLNQNDLEAVLNMSTELGNNRRLANEKELNRLKETIRGYGTGNIKPGATTSPLKGQKTNKPDGTYKLPNKETVTVKGGVIQ